MRSSWGKPQARGCVTKASQLGWLTYCSEGEGVGPGVRAALAAADTTAGGCGVTAPCLPAGVLGGCCLTAAGADCWSCLLAAASEGPAGAGAAFAAAVLLPSPCCRTSRELNTMMSLSCTLLMSRPCTTGCQKERGHVDCRRLLPWHHASTCSS